MAIAHEVNKVKIRDLYFIFLNLTLQIKRNNDHQLNLKWQMDYGLFTYSPKKKTRILEAGGGPNFELMHDPLHNYSSPET